MRKLVNGVGDFFSTMSALLSVSVKQVASSYCELHTADSESTLVTNDGSLVSIIRLRGVCQLIGQEEFERSLIYIQQSLQTAMTQPGHMIQVYFSYNLDQAREEIKSILSPARDTAVRLSLNLDDVFSERETYLTRFCASEDVYFVLSTRLKSLTTEQLKAARRNKIKMIKQGKIPTFRFTQNVLSAVVELRDRHEAFVRLVESDFKSVGMIAKVLKVHEAVRCIRSTVDIDFTDSEWRPLLPGDRVTVKQGKQQVSEITDITWAPLARQIIPRDAFNQDLKICQVGDRIYSCVFISLFPQQVQSFQRLFNRTLTSKIPWRISFHIESDGLAGTGIKKVLSSVLAFTSSQNKLLHNSYKLLDYINLNTDNAVVKLQVSACTWAPVGELQLLRSRASMLAKALEGWGSCDVSEVCGDAFQGAVSTMLAVSGSSVATPSIAPLSDVLYMLPLFRPASPWENGAILFRSPDGKPWPYQPGSSLQTTWIDIFYAKPGSGKSVLSNAINLAVCMSAGIKRLPRISIIDIGPSSSGLISLLRDALPLEQRRYVAHYRLRMLPEYAINPFDTQLGCRRPMPQERAFLVNFLSLLATPVGSETSYDGVSDMSGLLVDEIYTMYSDTGNPHRYTSGVVEEVDAFLVEIEFIADAETTWWEVTDALFNAGFPNEAMLAQRCAVPLLSDLPAICRLPAVEDLYGNIVVPTGETLIHAYSRMISSALREYPIISQVTKFDIGDARVIALDLDEVARSGGDAANRQTAVMYMLARYVLARHFFLTEDNVSDTPEAYQIYHNKRISQIRQDPKRLVFDEFHRTAKAQAVRDQMIVDMREGRKWNIQIAILSQSLDDFDEVMIEFATSVFIMDAGPEQAVRKTQKVFGLSDTAVAALRSQVHGPSASGATFLAQFSTKYGVNTQLLTATLGPVELWALSTTAEDVVIRNELYRRIGPQSARRLLASVFPGGTATALLEQKYANFKDDRDFIDVEDKTDVIEELIEELLTQFRKKDY